MLEPDRPAHGPQALRAMRDSELQATTPAEFTALLKTIQVRSKYNPTQIAQMAGLPRSQSYRLVTRQTLPSKPEQVEAFVTVCGLSAEQVQRVMRLWSELRELNDHPRTVACLTEAAVTQALSTWMAASVNACDIFSSDGTVIEVKRPSMNTVKHTSRTSWPSKPERDTGGYTFGCSHRDTSGYSFGCSHEEETPHLIFGQAVRVLREARGLSMAQLSSLASCSKGHLSEIENALAIPTHDLVRILDHVLDAGGILNELAPRRS